MEIISENEYQNKQKKIFNSIFRYENPLVDPFHNKIKDKLLLFECVYQLEQPWITPFIKTLKELNEEYYYVSCLHHNVNASNSDPNHWKVGLKETELELVGFGAIETLTYSCNGTWGIICSYEGHAILGGPKLMINNILNSIPDMNERLVKFLNQWKYYYKKNNAVNLNWIPPLLISIYGKEFTIDLLQANDIGWLIKNEDQ